MAVGSWSSAGYRRRGGGLNWQAARDDSYLHLITVSLLRFVSLCLHRLPWVSEKAWHESRTKENSNPATEASPLGDIRNSTCMCFLTYAMFWRCCSRTGQSCRSPPHLPGWPSPIDLEAFTELFKYVAAAWDWLKDAWPCRLLLVLSGGKPSSPPSM